MLASLSHELEQGDFRMNITLPSSEPEDEYSKNASQSIGPKIELCINVSFV